MKLKSAAKTSKPPNASTKRKLDNINVKIGSESNENELVR